MKTFFLFCLLALLLESFSASSPQSTSTEGMTTRSASSECLVQLNPEEDEQKRCSEIFTGHLTSYTLRTGFTIPTGKEDFYCEVFRSAILFASKQSNDFVQYVSDKRISVTMHCFFLSFFVEVMRSKTVSSNFGCKFVQEYSEAIALKLDAASEDIQVFINHVFPLLKELVASGNFLNYSYLLRTCVNDLTDGQADQLYTIHCLQYFGNESEAEYGLKFEVFKFGIEFLNLYIRRYEILSISGITNYRNCALTKPRGYYLIAFNPLIMVAEQNLPITENDLEKIKTTPLNFDNGVQLLNLLENLLLNINFLKYDTLEKLLRRKVILNNLIHFNDVILLVNLGLITCFRAWAQLQYNFIDEWTRTILEMACAQSPDPRFKEVFDYFIKK